MPPPLSQRRALAVVLLCLPLAGCAPLDVPDCLPYAMHAQGLLPRGTWSRKFAVVTVDLQRHAYLLHDDPHSLRPGQLYVADRQRGDRALPLGLDRRDLAAVIRAADPDARGGRWLDAEPSDRSH